MAAAVGLALGRTATVASVRATGDDVAQLLHVSDPQNRMEKMDLMRLDADEDFLPRARPPAYEKLERAHRELSKTVRHARWVQGVASHGWTDVAGSEGGIQTKFPVWEKG